MLAGAQGGLRASGRSPALPHRHGGSAAEIGVDMSIFPTPKHLASWAKVSPGNDQSAGRRRSGKTGKGNKWLRATLNESANAAARTKDSYLAAQCQRLRGRRGHSKAVTAVGHSILTAAWHMLQTGELFRDLGGDYFIRQNPTGSPNASSANSRHSDTT
jgi:transposase